MQEDRYVKSDRDLNVGDIIYQDMDKKDGLILNKGQSFGLCKTVLDENKKKHCCKS